MPPELRRSNSQYSVTDNESEDGGLYLPISSGLDLSDSLAHQSSTPIQQPRPQSLSLLQSPLHSLEYASPLSAAPHEIYDGDDADRTPIVTEGQEDGRLASTASSLPRPPTGDLDATVRQRPPRLSAPLLSPFAPRFPNQHAPQQQQQQQQQPQFVYAPPPEYSPVEVYNQQIMYPDPSNPGYYATYTASAEPSPQQSPYGPFQAVQMPQYIPGTMFHHSPTAPHQPHMTYTDPLPAQAQLPQYANNPYMFDQHPPRSRGGSSEDSSAPSISSITPSLTRSHSTTSLDVRMPSRPKVKLTREDKKRICEISDGNRALRQEDIARQYGVDRSTISKILVHRLRWNITDSERATTPRAPKPVGGRFPAIEERMHEWMDAEFATGRDVRDAEARDMAKAIAAELGFGLDRFKASAKWWDKFKERRRANGRALVSAAASTAMLEHQPAVPVNHGPVHGPYPSPYPAQYYPGYQGPVYANVISPAGSSVILSRSHSTATASSTSSSGNERLQQAQHQHQQLHTPHRLVSANRSDSDLLNHYATAAEMGHHQTNQPNRQRSQSSPQVLNQLGSVEPGAVSPSSGRVRSRPGSSSLSRQNSYSGASPSPRRPTGLTRANSSTSNLLMSASQRRANRPPSLAASAFGLTPMSQDGAWSPMPSPTTSGSSTGTHSRRRSEAGNLAPFTSSLSVMSISSSPGSMMVPPGVVPPLTPVSPDSYSGFVQQQGSIEDFHYAPQQMMYTQPAYHHGYSIGPGSSSAPDNTHQAPLENWQ